MAVKVNIAEGWTVEDGIDGYSETRVYDVTGLTGNESAKMHQALNTSGIPPRNEAHPIVAGIKVTRRSAEPLPVPDAARVRVTYSRPSGTVTDREPGEDPGVIEIGGTVQEEEVSRDINDNPLVVSYLKPNIDETSSQALVLDEQVARVDVQRPQMILSRTRVEAFPPFGAARRFQGSVNRFPIWGFESLELLCTRIQGTSSDNGTTYSTTYEFEYRPGGWFAVGVYEDPETGKPPKDLVNGQGIKAFRVYPEEDFRRLGIAF